MKKGFYFISFVLKRRNAHFVSPTHTIPFSQHSTPYHGLLVSLKNQMLLCLQWGVFFILLSPDKVQELAITQKIFLNPNAMVGCVGWKQSFGLPFLKLLQLPLHLLQTESLRYLYA